MLEKLICHFYSTKTGQKGLWSVGFGVLKIDPRVRATYIMVSLKSLSLKLAKSDLFFLTWPAPSCNLGIREGLCDLKRL